MSVLKLLQVTTDGRSKLWKHNASSQLLTFGTSRKAKIVSIDNNVQSFESVIEYKNSEWHYISFSTKNEKTGVDLVIKPNMTIKLEASTLKFEIVGRELELLKILNRLNSPAINLNSLY